jgi:ankyrin repeat protein
MDNTFEIIAFQIKIDKERKAEAQLKSLGSHLIRSVPKTNTTSTLLQKLTKYDSNFTDRCTVAKLLLECGANPNVQDHDGNTLLHLLARTAKPFVGGPRRNSALNHTSKPNDRVIQDIKACALIFLQHGAHADAKNNRGRTALKTFRKLFKPDNFDTFPFETLQCLAARTLRSSGYPTDRIPTEFVAFVMLH